jgi:tRNA(Ile)-lysidine synthase
VVERVEHIAPHVIHAIQEQGFLQKNDTVVVAVSGGADSVCLLHILAEWKHTLQINLHVAHLNHCLREHDSTEDADYVAGLAHKLGLPARIEARDVAEYRRQKRCSLEEAAREVRYRFLGEVVRSTGAAAVAVGHTRDDHIETILLHLLRGTGTAGLRGLQPLSMIHPGQGAPVLTVIRPLLDITRKDTVRYCHAHRLGPRIDTSNLSPDFLRNRIRHELLPVLEQYNPAIDAALLRLGSIADADVTYIEEQALHAWKDIADERPDALYLDRKKMMSLPHTLKRQLFRMALRRIAGNLRDFEADHIEAMLGFLIKPSGKELDLPHGIRLYSQYDNLVISASGKTACPFSPLEGESSIAIPGETVLPGWRIKARVTQSAAYDENAFSACFDFEKTGATLSVRPRKRGDRFQPLGMEHTRKLQDFMVDARVPQHWRNAVPVVASPAHILWIVGLRIDERVKVTDSTKNVLHLTFERTE